MAESNDVYQQQVEETDHTEDYQQLVDYGLNEKVAVKLDEIYKQGKLKHEDLNEGALNALKEFPVDVAVTVLKQFLESNLEHVSNKSSYLCELMKTYRQKQCNSTSVSADSLTLNPMKGPNEETLKAILDRSGYTLEVTKDQRKYGGPPPNWEGPRPKPNCVVYCGSIPKDLYEDELIPLFEKCGVIWELTLKMATLTGLNLGFAYVTFTTREAAKAAVRQLHNYNIRDNAPLRVHLIFGDPRLFVGNIPKSKSPEEITKEFSKRLDLLTEVIIYRSPDDKKKNPGFCFLQLPSCKATSFAELELKSLKVWGREIVVERADPTNEPAEDTMLKKHVFEPKQFSGQQSKGIVAQVSKAVASLTSNSRLQKKEINK